MSNIDYVNCDGYERDWKHTKAELIRPYDPDAGSKMMRYIPNWA